MAPRSPATGRARGARRRWLTLLPITALVLGLPWLRPQPAPDVTGAGAAAPSTRAAAGLAASAGPAVTPQAPIDPVARLRLPPVAAASRPPAAVPVRGRGTFGYAAGTGPVLGRSGPVRHFRVAVEWGSGEHLAGFAAQVQAVLADGRSWVGGGRLRLQRVAGGARSDFTVYLATRETAARMCAHGGIDIRVSGRPFTSCRVPGRAIINLDRWRLSAATFTRVRVPLATYRAYVINHEVGHELGKHHQGCPRRGAPAPVMVQQTLTLRGCAPYAWPRRGGRPYAGRGL